MTNEITGFVQFCSPIFLLGASNNVLIKLTPTLNCLCGEPVHNILVSWRFQEQESCREHREAFLASIRDWMHQYVRLHGLNQATLFNGKSNEVRVWCYVPERTSVNLFLTNTAAAFTPAHECPKWPSNLLSRIDLTVVRCFRHFCIVTHHPHGDTFEAKAFLPVPRSSTPLPPGTKLRVFGVWIFENRYLQPGILTSWLKDSGVSTSPLPSFRIEASSLPDGALYLALMTIFMPSLDVIDRESHAEGVVFAKSALNILTTDAKIATSTRGIQLAAEFICLGDQTPSPCLTHRLLTTNDLGDVTSAFQPEEKEVNLSGAKLRFLEPRASASQDLILIGRIGMQPITGAITIGPITASSDSLNFPVVFSSPNDTSLASQSLLREVVLIRQPRVALLETSLETSFVVRIFGRSLFTLPRLCVICDNTPTCLSVDGSAIDRLSAPLTSDAEMKQAGEKGEPILLRYVSSLSDDSTAFTIRYEDAGAVSGSTIQPSSNLHTLKIHNSLALWAFGRGLFNVGQRLHLKCVSDFPQPMAEPWSAPTTSNCHHLVGLYHWRILGVQETQDLLRDNAIQSSPNENRWISIQGHVFMKKVHFRTRESRQRLTLWLVDRHCFDPSASSPLRIDFLIPTDTDTRVITDFSRLPLLTHICLFKVRLQGRRLLLPLSPNRLQISPNSFSLYFATSTSFSCSCFPYNINNPVCNVCTRSKSHTTTQQLNFSPKTIDLLCDEKVRKTCLVHIIRCLEFRSFQQDQLVHVLLKMLVSDGSATAVVNFDSTLSTQAPDQSDTIAVLPLQCLSTVLGLEEAITRQVVTHLASVAEAAEDPVQIGLEAWFASSGFLRPVSLTLEKDITSSMVSYWRLENVSVGKEVRLTIAPTQKLRIVF